MTQTLRQGGGKLGAILSRLVVVLVLALFGVSQGGTDTRAAQVGPVAANQIDHPHGILSAQRDWVAAPLPGDDRPDLAEPATTPLAQRMPRATRISSLPQRGLHPVSLHILPSVRGPPAA
ncbi:hypothetical protein SAMN05443999_112116 [Roseovarius azorensis]|uniref:Uncharacterized protein n=1 Tax=Roseovarius azorensis TaxID=1287727 RepID=A0A1H7VJI3_9RHOB|nr:hypothetical protein [Roseovarius azorensis]SEM09441.1 hypothetical protein SAMN05443999_112116 [Roseovarius azorensis]